MVNSNRKGKEGERQLARKLNEYGYSTRRSQQYNGVSGDSDLIGLPGIHVEVKRVEKLNIYDAIARAIKDAKKGLLAAVFHRKNNTDWLVTMPLDDFMKIYAHYETSLSMNEFLELKRDGKDNG